MKNFGDLGWDSNAYHISLVGMLIHFGASNWDESVSLGAYTIFSPYGAHSLGAFWVSLFHDFRYAVGPSLISLLGILLVIAGYKSHLRPQKLNLVLRYIIALGIVLSPTIFGQSFHYYVDSITGIYLFAAILLINNFLDLPNPKYLLLSSMFLGLSVSSKTQAVPGSILLMLFALIIFVRSRKDKKYLASYICSFLLGGSIPYLRNTFEYGNPLYPFRILSLEGIVSIKEIRSAINFFLPNWWSNLSIVQIIFSILFSVYISLIRDILFVMGVKNEHSSGFSAYSYDSIVGGYGLLLTTITISFLIMSVRLNKIKNVFDFKPKKGFVGEKSFSAHQLGLYLTIFVSLMLTPGGWWPRYSIGLGFGLLILPLYNNILDEESIIRKKAIYILAASSVLVQIIGFCIFMAYEVKNVSLNATLREPKLGLNTGIQEKFFQNCSKFTVVEPRSTFTSIAWQAWCRDYENLGEKEFLSKLNLGAIDYAVMNRQIFERTEKSMLTDYDIKEMVPWFDTERKISSILIRKKVE